MGIHSEFKYGINLYNYSFAFSYLKTEAEKEEADLAKNRLNHGFLASISRELFNGISKNGRTHKPIILDNWAFTCI